MSKWFWVIFDTSQLMKYYEDVHNILAQPLDSTIRYNYKLNLLSEDALKKTQGKSSAPVLLVYMQKNAEYERGDKYSVAPPEELPFLYVATRLANMLGVTRDGESFYFDFQLKGYPLQGETLSSLMRELEAKGEVPWSKNTQGKPAGCYVCTCEDSARLKELEGGDEQTNWSNIVNLLSAPPMQFRRDSFWRLKGPYSRHDDRLMSPHIEILTERGKRRQSQALYRIRENSSWRFELVSEIGRGTAPQQPVVVETTVSDDKVLKFAGNSRFSLRRYSAIPVEFRSLTAELLGTSFSEMAFRTTPQPTDWVTGATFSLKFALKRNRLRVAVGVIAGFLSAAAYVFGDSKLLDCVPLIQILLKIGAILSGALAVFALTGQLTFSGK